jgi:hypothetical protein
VGSGELYEMANDRYELINLSDDPESEHHHHELIERSGVR